MHLNIPRNKAEWEESDTRINHWLSERQELIVQFNALCNLRPYKVKEVLTGPVNEFTCTLVDYVSAGQFEILETIFDAASHSPQQVPFDKHVMVAWLTTTNQALDFAERYSDTDFAIASLEKDLERLGTQLADRLEIEDRLIELYAQATSVMSKDA